MGVVSSQGGALHNTPGIVSEILGDTAHLEGGVTGAFSYSGTDCELEFMVRCYDNHFAGTLGSTGFQSFLSVGILVIVKSAWAH